MRAFIKKAAHKAAKCHRHLQVLEAAVAFSVAGGVHYLEALASGCLGAAIIIAVTAEIFGGGDV